MDWYKKELLTFLKIYKYEIFISSLLWLVSLTLYFYFIESHEWLNYTPIPEPTLTIQVMSALGFVWLWRVLYKVGFYYILHFFVVRVWNDIQSYKDIKQWIWGGVCLITGFVIVPFIIDIMNSILSFLYNIILETLYYSPIIWISWVLFLFWYFYYRFIAWRRCWGSNNYWKNQKNKYNKPNL